MEGRYIGLYVKDEEYVELKKRRNVLAGVSLVLFITAVTVVLLAYFTVLVPDESDDDDYGSEPPLPTAPTRFPTSVAPEDLTVEQVSI